MTYAELILLGQFQDENVLLSIFKVFIEVISHTAAGEVNVQYFHEIDE